MSEKKSKKGSGGFVTSDPRFSQIYSDPRFRAPKSKDLKVHLDDRFNKKELNIDESTAKVDKYGRKINRAEKKKEDNAAFDKLYTTGEKEDEDEDDVMARARGLVSGEESSDSSSDEEESSSESETVEKKDVYDEVEEEAEVPEGEPTKRLAAVNLDWDHITSKDLYAAFIGFVPVGGKIKEVSIYPSEYGKMKMKEEEEEGPPKEFFEDERELSSDDDSDSEINGEIDIKKATKKLYKEDQGGDYNSKALRKYELQRLRYYYAVITLDSVDTSKQIYTECDGTEYESTANTFDLRYVPDGMTFDDEPRDTCSDLPSEYKPTDFTTDALRSSKVKLTWDETPAQRMEVTKRAFSAKEVDDMDFEAYVASDSEEEDAEKAEEMKKKYRSLLKGVSRFDSDDKDDDVDLEVTFTPGLSETANKPEEEREETTIEKYRNKEKERRKKRKAKIKELKRKEREEMHEGRRGRKETKQEKEEEEEVSDSDKHFKMKDIIKAEKLKHKKKMNKKQKKQAEKLAGIDENIELDKNDTRFDEIFEDPSFAIDPTNPEYKKTSVMKKLMKEGKQKAKSNAEKQKRGEKRNREEVDKEAERLVGDIKKKVKHEHKSHKGHKKHEHGKHKHEHKHAGK